MFFQTNVQCPHCNKNNKIDVEVTDKKSITGVYTCSNELSCSRDFALYSTLSIKSFVKCIAEESSEVVEAS